MSRKLQLIALVVLAVATAIVAAGALYESKATARDTAAVATVSLPPVLTPTASSTTASPTATPSYPGGLAGLKARLADGVGSVLVLGDGSGAGTNGWVAVWAKQLSGDTRKATYHAWDSTKKQWSPAMAAGSGSIGVWNASLADGDLGGAAARVAQLWPDADVVLLSYGHDAKATDIGKRLSAVKAAILAKNGHATVIAIRQNPDPSTIEQPQIDAVEAVAAWAKTAKVDTVDVYDAFVSDPEPRYQLIDDKGMPTKLGAALWAKTLAAAIAKA